MAATKVAATILLAVLASLLLCLAASNAEAAPKAKLKSCGTPNGSAGGQLIFARGVATNQTGNGAPAGSVYVAEGNTNHRVSQYSADCTFIRAWGWDVVASGPGDDTTAPEDQFEICVPVNGDVCKAGVSGGAAGQLAAPQGIGIDQSNGYLYVTSVGNRRVDVFSGDGQFAGAFGYDVLPADANPSGPDFCTSATGCQTAAAAGAQAGRFSNLTGAIPAVDPSAPPGRVFVPDAGNLRVAQYSTTVDKVGKVLTAVTFDNAFGWDVIAGGTPALESCTSVTGCQAGQVVGSTNNPGQFTSGGSPTAVAIDGTGAIYVASGPLTSGTCSAATPCRIQKFAPNASSATDFGPSSGPGQLTFTSGAANTVAALNLAVDPSNNHVYVLRKETTTSYRILEYESSGTLVETHPVGTALTGVTATVNTGLAVGTDERIYTNYGAAGAGELIVLGPVPPAHPEVTSVDELTATSARFKGTVTITPPGGPGFEAKYNFAYSSNGIKWESTAVKTTGSAAQGYAVEAVAPKLSPNTDYQVRLAATTSETVTSEPVFFKTPPASPEVTLAYTEEVTQNEARLSARIDPQGLKTSYYFEWSTQKEWEETGEYSHRAPAFARQIGSGNDPIIVQESIQDLTAGTAYRFEVVASNAAGKATDVQVFETLNSCGYTGERCIELVSPSDKGPVGAAGDLVALGQEIQFQASSSGSSIAYVMGYGMKDATAPGEVFYQADRQPFGWVSKQLIPPLTQPSVEQTGSDPSKMGTLSKDLSCAVLPSTELLTPDAPQETRDAGQANLYKRDASGGYEVITSLKPTNLSSGGSVPLEQYDVIGVNEIGADDCSTVLFRTRFQYQDVPGAGIRRSYEWDDGNLHNVGVVPGPSGLEAAEMIPGAAASSEVSVALGGQGLANHLNSFSEDGTRIYFTAISRVGGDIGQQAVFMRERTKGTGDVSEGSTVVTNTLTTAGTFSVGQEVSGPGIPSGTTIVSVGGGTLELSQPATVTTAGAPLRAVRVIDVSQSQNPGTPNNRQSQYETASTDGSVVFFTARYGLAEEGTPPGSTNCVIGSVESPNGPGCALYRYSVNDGTLTELSVSAAGTDNANGPSVAGVLGASDDGNEVYFAARGQLLAGQGSTEAENLAENAYSVYLSEDDQVSYVGRLGRSVSARNALLSSSRQFWSARVSSDGRYLLFASQTPFTELGQADNGTRREAYLYDATSDETVCVSCRKDDEPSLAPADAEPLVSGGWDLENPLRPPATLTVSEDGTKVRVFFISYNKLAAGAIGSRPNLYMWENGQTSFLGSSGPSAVKELRFAGASATGDDVYFTSVDRLTWQDTDSKLDVYDVRVGGGFAEPPPSATPCDPLSEGSCRGSLDPSPILAPPIGTSSFFGTDKIKQSEIVIEPKKGKKPKKHKAKNKKRKSKKRNSKHKRNRSSATRRANK